MCRMNMRKYFKKLFIFAAVVMMAVMCLALECGALTSGGYEYVILDNGTVEITDYEGTVAELYVPSEIEGKKVTSVADGAFDGCAELREIHLPVSLEHMGDTFYDCSGLAVYYMGDIYQWMKVEGWENVSDWFNVITEPHICTETVIKGKAATCTQEGLSDGRLCTVCSVITQKQTVIPAKGHSYTNSCDKTCNVCKATRSVSHTYKTTTTKATLKKNGKQVTKCTVCGDVKSSKTIYYPKSIKLSATSYTYNGKTKKPTVTVKDSKGKTLKKDTDYTVKYASGRKNPGKYTVTVTFKGKYSGTKKLSFTIKPAKATLSKVSAGSKQLTATWKTVTAVTGYEVQASTSSKFTSKTTKKATVKSAKTKKTTIKKLTKGKKYYVRVRAYKTVDGKKIYGAWSTVKSVKVK